MTHSAKPIDSTLKSELTDELILILDGAMGTMIQTRQLDETDYRGNLFESHPHSLTGCNDILCITSPQTITDIHNEYISAGARIISTNTFNANAISMAEYGLQDYVEQINRAAVQCARKAIETSNKTHRIWIAGSIGPTNKSLSMTTLADQENEQLTFESLSDTYRSQAHALIDAGADTLLIETIFDTLNAKAAIAGSMQAMQQAGREVPIMLSVTLTETGRTLSGQTIDAFIASVSHCAPLSIGLNCGFGPEQLRHYLRQLSAYGIPVSFHPNAGLPDAFGNYALSPDDFASQIADAISGTNVRIIGGCCGTTPAHIHAIASHPKCTKAYPLQGPATTDLVLSGLESMHIPSHGKELTKIGERCNVAGSRKFLRLIKENNLDEAVSIAVSQVKAGAKILDINLDDGMLDAPYEMARFLNRIAADPVASAIPVMIDSSSWDVICKGLQHTQGKCIVNSISLKDGEDEFLQRACQIRQMGAAVVVMAMDEHGQAETYERKLEICKRAYSLLTGKTGFKPQEIIFDPNVLTIATGIQEHDNYAVEFIRAAEAIKDCMPGVHVSGGISNLSFAFRGIDMVRKAMHAEFISLAKGLDMAILNPSVSLNPSDFPSDVRNAVRDAILNTDPKATERLTAIAHEIKNETKSDKNNIIRHSAPTQSSTTPADILTDKIIAGSRQGIETLIKDQIADGAEPIHIIEHSLMKGIEYVGQLFGAGKIFLPQVVRSADAMQYAVNILAPYITSGTDAGNKKKTSAPKVILATVKGDVHDIGKNIVGILLRCNGFKVIDMGTKQPADRIVSRAIAENADFIALSGLITPSLHEMVEVAARMQSDKLHIPLFVGGAATSAEHAAVKIAPVYSGPVFHTHEAAALPPIAKCMLDETGRSATIDRLHEEQQKIRDSHNCSKDKLLSLSEARKKGLKPYNEISDTARSISLGTQDLHIPVNEIIPLINWRQFLSVWQIDASLATVCEINGCDHCKAQWLSGLPKEKRSKGAEAMQLHKDACRILSGWAQSDFRVKARIVTADAYRYVDDIVINNTITIPTIRRQRPEKNKPFLSVADFVGEQDANDRISLFAVTVGEDIRNAIDDAAGKSEYIAMVAQAIADRLAEAATEWLHRHISGGKGIRPAIGYQSLPDQSLVFIADRLINYKDLGIQLTENGAMYPQASTTGLFIYREDAVYFTVGPIDAEQFADYTMRRGIPAEKMKTFLRVSEQ